MNIIELNNEHFVEVIPDNDFQHQFISACFPDDYFDSLGEKYEDADIELSEKIESVLLNSYPSTEENPSWIQSDMCNGDGIRTISFTPDALLTNNDILLLKSLLHGDYEKFSILCLFHEDFDSDSSTIGCIGIFTNKILISDSILIYKQ